MKLAKQCIVCGTSENLNTSFDVVLFGNTYKVYLCNSHEDTTMKAAREELQNRLMKIDEFIDEAKSFGLNIVLRQEDVQKIAEDYGMVCISKEEYENLKSRKAAAGRKQLIAPSQELVKQMSQRQPSQVEAEVLQGSSEEVDYVPQVESVVPEGQFSGDMLRYAPMKTKREKNMIVKNRNIETKGGRVVEGVTTLMKSPTGTTKIHIIQNVDDADLQRKMRNYDQASKMGMEVNRKNMWRNCISCRGNGAYANGTICARCKGSGLVSNF